MSTARALTLLLMIAVATVAAATHGTWWRLPDRHNPWAPLNVQEPPGWLTRFKLGRLDRDPAVCLAALETAAFRWTPVPDRVTGPGCGFTNAVRITRMQAQVGEAFTLTCQAAVSLALWEAHVLLPEAARLLDAPVQRIDHLGSYACRNLYGRPEAPRSQHATANAIDIAGFTLRGGQRVTVARHWQGEDERAEFLQAVNRGACRFFDGVLGPHYNIAHADHLHLDRGPYRVCR